MNNQTHKKTPSASRSSRPAGKQCRSVYIVDDDAAVCHSLALLFENADYAVHTFGSAGSLLAAVTRNTTGVLILDLFMADMSGLELQAELDKRDIYLKTIFLSGYGTIEKSVLAIKGGAIDFIEKPYTRKQLLNSVEEALLQVRTEEEERRQHDIIKQRYERLTPREREIIKYLVRGDSSRQLAELLGLSSRTVEIHRSKIMRKLEVTSLPDLVRTVCSSSNTRPEEALIDLCQSLQLQQDKKSS